MSYLYDLHVHSKECSACASADVISQIDACRNFGLDGFVLTNHFLTGNNCVPAELSWEEKMKYYCLLNNNSLSAAIVLAARLKNKNGLLLGQNCGQPYKFYAWGGGVQKTKRGIRFKCSKKLQICKVDGKVLSNNKPFPVDYEVQTTIEDLKKNKDAVLSYCESLIKQHKLNAEKF
jgi:hypothetical protein